MYGNEALWVVIPADGVVGAAAKFPTVRLVSGQLSARATRLDGAAPPGGIDIPDGYGAIGFQAFGVQFPTQGCWEVTQELAGHELRFVVRVS